MIQHKLSKASSEGSRKSYKICANTASFGTILINICQMPARSHQMHCAAHHYLAWPSKEYRAYLILPLGIVPSCKLVHWKNFTTWGFKTSKNLQGRWNMHLFKNLQFILLLVSSQLFCIYFGWKAISATSPVFRSSKTCLRAQYCWLIGWTCSLI